MNMMMMMSGCTIKPTSTAMGTEQFVTQSVDLYVQNNASCIIVVCVCLRVHACVCVREYVCVRACMYVCMTVIPIFSWDRRSLCSGELTTPEGSPRLTKSRAAFASLNTTWENTAIVSGSRFVHT